MLSHTFLKASLCLPAYHAKSVTIDVYKRQVQRFKKATPSQNEKFNVYSVVAK